MATVVQGPTDDDDKNELQKAWTMEMLMSDGHISMTMTKGWMMEMLMSDIDISMTMMNGPEQMSEDYKKFLYARATH